MQEIAKTLTWTFIHSLWQGLLAALLCAIIISSTRNAPARLRYNLLGIVMILFFASSIVTFITQWHVEAKLVTTPFAAIPDDTQVISNIISPMDNFMGWVNSNSDAIIVLWTFFFFLSCIRLVTGVAAVNRLKHYKTHPVTNDWKIKLGQLQLVTGVRCSVSLLQSELVKVPMAFGILKPVILLPLGLLTHLPAEQVETILLHELAHIRRKDYLVNLLQHIAEAIFFFNPAIRWISSLIRQEREACCDDMVVAGCEQKTDYLKALINFQEYSFSHSSHAMGISSKRHYLLNRVKRMITNKNKGINLFEKVALLAGVILFSAFNYITKETDAKAEPVNPISYSVEQAGTEVLPIVVSKPAQAKEYRPVKKKNTNKQNKLVTDTVPKRKNKTLDNKNSGDNKPPVKLGDREQATQDANATLQEIIQLKNQIGLKKENIGKMKEQLITKDGQEKEKILDEIERERDEINEKRRELDLKRERLENLREKAKEKQAEEKRSESKRVNKEEKAPTIANNHANQWDKSDQWDVSVEKEYGVKPSPGSTGSQKNKIEIDNNKWYKQEYQYKIGLSRKDPPRVKQQPPAPENLKTPGAPAKKAKAVRPYTAN